MLCPIYGDNLVVQDYWVKNQVQLRVIIFLPPLENLYNVKDLMCFVGCNNSCTCLCYLKSIENISTHVIINDIFHRVEFTLCAQEKNQSIKLHAKTNVKDTCRSRVIKSPPTQYSKTNHK